MAVCRFCGARLKETALPCDCPLCGRHNDPGHAPVRLEWSGEGFARSDDVRLPFASCVVVAPGQRALLRLDGRDAVLDEGRHAIYPVGPDGARAAFVSVEWRAVQDAVTHVMPWPEAVWELRVRCALEARVADPQALLLQSPFDGDLEARIAARLHDALEAALRAALCDLAPLPQEGRDALALRVDGALARIDDRAVNGRLAESGWLEARGVSMRRELLVAEDANGEPCPVCGRKNSGADGSNAACAFCGTRLFWCPNCRRHVLRSDGRWCPVCRGRLYA